MLRVPLLVGFLALGVTACGVARPKDPAESASRLLAAAMQNDRTAFEKQIDRPALREDVRRQVSQFARATSLDVEGGPSEFALDRMISPEAFRVVRVGSHEALARPPTPAEVAPLIKPVDKQHVCLQGAETPHDCLLTFARGKDGWRLVGMKAMDLRIEVASAGL
jgi:hypothetical protein